jgi:sulfur carrier protein ThiS
MSSCTLNLVELPNPLKPHEIFKSTREFSVGASVQDLYPRVGTVELVIALNGKIIPAEERATTPISDGDYLVVAPVLHGGEDGKQVLRIVALIALAVFAPAVAAQLSFAMGGGMFLGSVTGLAVMEAGVMLAGGMLINALLPPPKPKQPQESSPTYGIDGAKNTSAEGVPTPVIYGEFRYGGNILNNYVVNDGDTQWLYILLNAGEGPIGVINEQSIELNGQPISAFKDWWIEQRDGSHDQTPIPWFADTQVPQTVNHKLTQTFHQFTTTTEVDRLRFDFTAPAGIQYIGAGGDAQNASVPVEIQYRLNGTTTWQTLPGSGSVTGYDTVNKWDRVVLTMDEYGNPILYTTYVPTGAEVLVGNTWYIERVGADGNPEMMKVGERIVSAVSNTNLFVVSGNQTTALRRSFFSHPLPEGVYDVRVRRTTEELFGQDIGEDTMIDQLYWTDVVEITTEDVAYRHTALLALKIRLGDQLSGIPTITYIHPGKKIQVWNEQTQQWVYESNASPAWVTFDILSNQRYGGGAARSRFVLDKWKDWAIYCAEKQLKFNGVFDTQTNVWDASQISMRCGHAQMVRVGTRYSVAIERAEEPVMMFSVANMIKGSFRESWTSVAERANEIEGTYHDKEDSYKPRTIRVYDAAAINAGHPQRSTPVELKGVTSAQQAWDDLNIMLNMNRYIQRSIQFSAPVEAIACTIGSVILVQHDMPAWGVGGRVEAGNTTTVVNLDRPVTMEQGKLYKLWAHHSAVQRYTGTVASVVNGAEQTSLVLNGFNGTQVVDRIKVAGKDVRVDAVFQSGAQWGVTIASTAVSAGAAYELWATDVIETVDVNNPSTGAAVTVEQVTLAAALVQALPQYSNFMFGEVNKVAKPFRVKSISGTHESKRDIVALEYNASVYNPAGAVPTPNYSSLVTTVQHVTIDGVDERIVQHGISYKSRVTVRYSSSQQTYQSSNVYLSRNGGAFEWVGKDIYSVTVDGATGEVLKFKVVAVDVTGKSAPDSTAPVSANYTVLGKTYLPSQVTGLQHVFTNLGIEFSFNAPSDDDWLTTQASTTELFAAGTVVFDAKTTKFLWDFRAAGSHTLWFRHTFQGGRETTPVSRVVPVLRPADVIFQPTVELGQTVTCRWNDCKTSQPLKHYIVKIAPVGDTTTAWAALPEFTRLPGNTQAQTFTFDTVGTRRIYIMAEDVAGNTSATAAWDTVTTSAPLDGQDGVDGEDGTPGQNAVTALLSSEAVVLPANVAGAVTSYDGASTTIKVLNGGTDDTANWSFTRLNGPNVTSTLVDATLTVTSLGETQDSSYVDITATRSGYPSLTKRFSVSKSKQGSAGASPIELVLTNEAHVVPADAAGTVTSFAGAATTAFVFNGSADDTANWTLTRVNTNCTSTISGATFTVTAMTADVAYVDVTATRSGYPTQTARFTITKAKAGTSGTNGTNGQNATAYWLSRSIAAIQKSAAGAYTPTSVTFTAYSATGTAAPAPYAGRFIIATSTDGTTYTNQYTSSANESSKAYTIPASIKTVRVRIYLAGGTTTLLDEEIVPVVSDGTNGTNGAQGPRGATRASRVVATASWSDAEANAAITSAGYAGPIDFDEVTLYKTDGTFAQTRVRSGTSWLTMAAVIDGNLLVRESVLADRINTRGLDIKDSAGNVIFSAGQNLAMSRINANFGSNLLYNGDFSSGLDGWTYGTPSGVAPSVTSYNFANWWLQAFPGRAGSNVFYTQQVGGLTVPSGETDWYYEYIGPACPVEGGKRYVVSAYTGAHRCAVNVFFYWYDAAGALGGWSDNAGNAGPGSVHANANEAGGGTALSGYKRIYDSRTLPSNAAFVRPVIRKMATLNGYADSYAFVGRVQIEEVPAGVSTPGPWSTSGITDQTAVRALNPITSGNASTYIANAAIGSAQVGVLTAANLTVQAMSNTINGSAGSGQRVEVQTNRVLVYDSSNVLRVKLGDLS